MCIPKSVFVFQMAVVCCLAGFLMVVDSQAEEIKKKELQQNTEEDDQTEEQKSLPESEIKRIVLKAQNGLQSVRNNEVKAEENKAFLGKEQPNIQGRLWTRPEKQ